tara:strand:- start:341 stop:577 length:237 start_codon:yes stop_codon:yes gene_type:complete
MLTACRNAVSLKSLDNDASQPTDLYRFARQCMITYYRVGLIVPNVKHRGEVKRDTNSRQLASQCCSKTFYESRITHAP